MVLYGRINCRSSRPTTAGTRAVHVHLPFVLSSRTLLASRPRRPSRTPAGDHCAGQPAFAGRPRRRRPLVPGARLAAAGVYAVAARVSLASDVPLRLRPLADLGNARESPRAGRTGVRLREAPFRAYRGTRCPGPSSAAVSASAWNSSTDCLWVAQAAAGRFPVLRNGPGQAWRSPRRPSSIGQSGPRGRTAPRARRGLPTVGSGRRQAGLHRGQHSGGSFPGGARCRGRSVRVSRSYSRLHATTSPNERVSCHRWLVSVPGADRGSAPALRPRFCSSATTAVPFQRHERGPSGELERQPRRVNRAVPGCSASGTATCPGPDWAVTGAEFADSRGECTLGLAASRPVGVADRTRKLHSAIQNSRGVGGCRGRVRHPRGSHAHRVRPRTSPGQSMTSSGSTP